MSGTKMGVVGCGGRMGRMLIAEIAATDGCLVAGGSEAPDSGYVNQDIGELAGIGRHRHCYRRDSRKADARQRCRARIYLTCRDRRACRRSPPVSARRW